MDKMRSVLEEKILSCDHFRCDNVLQVATAHFRAFDHKSPSASVRQIWLRATQSDPDRVANDPSRVEIRIF